VVFRETTLFTKQVVEKLTDSEYRESSARLVTGKGKRGGLRIIYYCYVD
jgi:hypothetical protein